MYTGHYAICIYSIYLTVSVIIAPSVRWALHKNCCTFLVETSQGREDLADSVNHLLVVGFYLGTIGFMRLALKYGVRPVDVPGVIEALATKVGMVLSVLGVLHFANIFLVSSLRWRVRLVAPQERVSSPGGAGQEDPWRRRRCLGRLRLRESGL